MIRVASVDDAAEICAIYNHYVAHTVVTFEEEPVGVAAMAQRMQAIQPQLPWLVWTEGPQVLGFSYAGKWKERSAYCHSVESTIYLRPGALGRRIGSRLYEALLGELRARPIHTVIGGIALPNPASVALHERFGFIYVGRFRDVGRKLERWVDVGYWQLIL